jgi:hypothetical protein
MQKAKYKYLFTPLRQEFLTQSCRNRRLKNSKSERYFPFVTFTLLPTQVSAKNRPALKIKGLVDQAEDEPLGSFSFKQHS